MLANNFFSQAEEEHFEIQISDLTHSNMSREEWHAA